jgi:hypothetical protein
MKGPVKISFLVVSVGASLVAGACGPGAPQVSNGPLGPPRSSVEPRPPEPCPPDVYTSAEEYAGRAPELPPVPDVPDGPKKIGDAYTVFGAAHALRSRFESRDVTAKEIAIVGFIADSNLASAPKCALHKTGQKDPEGCVTEIPSFVLADSKDGKTGPRIKVLGWASNFAAVFDANALYAKGKPAKAYLDERWMVEVPYPLPAVGAKVKVTGRYGFMFTKSSTGVVADPRTGVMTYARLEVLEPAAQPAKLGK